MTTVLMRGDLTWEAQHLSLALCLDTIFLAGKVWFCRRWSHRMSWWLSRIRKMFSIWFRKILQFWFVDLFFRLSCEILKELWIFWDIFTHLPHSCRSAASIFRFHGGCEWFQRCGFEEPWDPVYGHCKDLRSCWFLLKMFLISRTSG